MIEVAVRDTEVLTCLNPVTGLLVQELHEWTAYVYERPGRMERRRRIAARDIREYRLHAEGHALKRQGTRVRRPKLGRDPLGTVGREKVFAR
jgi:hypothetical protein